MKNIFLILVLVIFSGCFSEDQDEDVMSASIQVADLSYLRRYEVEDISGNFVFGGEAEIAGSGMWMVQVQDVDEPSIHYNAISVVEILPGDKIKLRRFCYPDCYGPYGPLEVFYYLLSPDSIKKEVK